MSGALLLFHIFGFTLIGADTLPSLMSASFICKHKTDVFMMFSVKALTTQR